VNEVEGKGITQLEKKKKKNVSSADEIGHQLHIPTAYDRVWNNGVKEKEGSPAKN